MVARRTWRRGHDRKPLLKTMSDDATTEVRPVQDYWRYGKSLLKIW